MSLRVECSCRIVCGELEGRCPCRLVCGELEGRMFV